MKRGRSATDCNSVGLAAENERLQRRVEELEQDAAERLAEYNLLQGACEQHQKSEEKCMTYRMMIVTILSDMNTRFAESTPSEEDEMGNYVDSLWYTLAESSVVPTNQVLEDWRNLSDGTKRCRRLTDYVYRGEDEADTLKWLAEP